MPEPRFIITGANGFIGGHLIRHLDEHKHTALLLSRRRPETMHANFQWQRWEAGTPANLTGVSPDTCVIHLATRHHVENPTPDDNRLCVATNVNGTRQLLADSTAAGLHRFIYFSTIKAAPPATDSLLRRESDPEHTPPNTAYGRSKLAAEKEVRSWTAAAPNRSALIIRPAVVYGPQSVANIFLLVQAIARRRFFLAGRNDNIKSVVSVRNLVAATLFLAQRMQPGADSFYLADRENYSVRDFSTLIASSLDSSWRIPTLPVPFLRAGAFLGDAIVQITGRKFPLTQQRLGALLEHSAFSCDKLTQAGFVHPQTTREGLAEMTAWLCQRPRAAG